MTYKAYCREHHKVCSPVYWRPEGRTFHRIYKIVYCPGDDKNPHLAREVFDLYGSRAVPLDKT